MNFWWVRDTTSQCVLLALYPSRGTIALHEETKNEEKVMLGSGLDNT